MRKIIVLLAVLCFGLIASAQQDSAMMRRIYDEVLANGHAYANLEYLCKKIGPRLSGSANYNKAVEWGKLLMEKYGFDKVYCRR